MKIQSRLSVDQCIAELKRLTINDTLFGAMFVPDRSVICKISGLKFRLREKRSYGNAFAPHFFGSLTPNDSGTEIAGDFRIHPVPKAFLVFWFGFLALFTVQMLVKEFQHQGGHSASGNSALMFVAPLGMMAFGYGLICFCRWAARNEQVRITQFLEATFGDAKPASPLDATFATVSQPEPVMWRAVLFFGVLGVVSVSSGISGVSSVHAQASNSPGSQSAFAITYFHDRWEEAFVMVNGLFLLLLTYGVWKRLRVAWKMGFALFAFSAVTFVLSILGDSQTIAQRDNPLAFSIFGIVGGLAVGAYWTYWWYKKRPYFDAKHREL